MERQAAACVSDGRPPTEGLRREQDGFSLRSPLHQQDSTCKLPNGFHGSEGRGAASCSLLGLPATVSSRCDVRQSSFHCPFLCNDPSHRKLLSQRSQARAEIHPGAACVLVPSVTCPLTPRLLIFSALLGKTTLGLMCNE